MEMLYQSQFNREYAKFLNNGNMIAFNNCMDIAYFNVNVLHITLNEAKEELKRKYAMHLALSKK